MSEAKMIRFPEGEIIMREGEINTNMYKIISGHAELYVDYGTSRETLLGIIGAQACFGELGLLLEKPSIYTVIAYSDILALRITEGDMGDFVQENHKNIIEIMRNMASSMMTMHCQLELLTKELEEGIQRDEEERKEEVKKAVRQATLNMRKYAVYNSNAGSSGWDFKA